VPLARFDELTRKSEFDAGMTMLYFAFFPLRHADQAGDRDNLCSSDSCLDSG